VFNWSATQVSNYTKFYDGARGEKVIERKITVYRSCADQEWISKEKIYLCWNNNIYKCKYRLSSDEVGIVSNTTSVGEVFISNNIGGYVCKDDGFHHDITPPLIKCESCFKVKGGKIEFSPEISDPEPGAGLKSAKICADSVCKQTLCNLENNKCTYEIRSCSFEDKDFWIYAEDRVRNKNIIYGGKFRILKSLGCECSFDSECASGSCRGSPSICAESTRPQIDIK
jgi:hypothetical protein